MSSKAKIIAYMACTKNRVIGNSENLPFKLPWAKLEKDFERFKETTSNYVVVMGRVTAETFKRPLPNRINVILTRKTNWLPPLGFIKALNLAQALGRYEYDYKKIFIIGGAQILYEAIQSKVLDEIIMTEAYGDYPGDVYLPESFNTKNFEEVKRQTFLEYEYDVVTYKPIF